MSEGVMAKPLKNFNGSKKAQSKASSSKQSQLQAAETKYNLACLLVATTQVENARLRQELANVTAIANYYRACYQ